MSTQNNINAVYNHIHEQPCSTQSNNIIYDSNDKLAHLNTCFYTSYILCKHNILFKTSQHKTSSNISLKAIIIPLFNVIKTCDNIIGKNIIMCDTIVKNE